MRYFMAGNFWLFMALLLVLGKTYERSSPLRYSSFGMGHWFTPAGYNLLVLLVFALALLFFFLDLKARRPS